MEMKLTRENIKKNFRNWFCEAGSMFLKNPCKRKTNKNIWYYCSDNEVQHCNKDVREESAKHCLYLFLRKRK